MKNVFFKLLLLVVVINQTSCKNKKTLEYEKNITLWNEKFENSAIRDTILLENFFTGKTITSKEFFTQRNRIILQYSDLNCNTCVDSIITKFKVLSTEIGPEHTAIIAATDNRRYLANFVRVNKLHIYDLYIIPIHQYKLLYADDPNMPFIYTSDKSLKVQNFFIPSKEMPNRTYEYFNDIIKRYDQL